MTVAGVPGVTATVPEVTWPTAKSVTPNGKVPEVPPPGVGLVTVRLNVPAAAISAAVIAAVTCVALTSVVIATVPLKFTNEEELKFVPFTVSVNAAAPLVALVGESVVMVGTGLFTVNVEIPDVPPPGVGLDTVTLNVPAAAICAAAMAAEICVALMNVVAVAVPLKFTTEDELKFVPFTVNAKAAPPAVPLVGEIVVMVGTGLLTAKGCAADGPVVGAGLVAVTLMVPVFVISAAGIVAVICVALTKVAARELPLKETVAPDKKPVPLTVNVKEAPPTIALLGESDVIVGTGLFTVNCEFPEVPPPGARLVTVTLNVPAAAISAAVTEAVNCVALTNVVDFAEPLKFTTEVETKLVPFTVSEKAGPPDVAFAGERDAIVGTGLVTVNVELPDVPPPGFGFVTDTLNVPAAAMSVAATCIVS